MPENKFVRDVYNIDPSIPFVEDADGNLIGRPSVTCIGVFPYLLEDGTVFNELRLPEEVFSKETLDSLKMIPVTNDHPTEMVTPENIGKYQVGTTGEDVCRADFYSGIDGGVDAMFYKTDGTQVTIPVKITQREAIDAVKAGKRGLSCGYTRELEIKDGVWNGVHYDGIQRSIRYNHLAICDRGRAGDAAIIRMDSADNNGEKTFVPTYIEKVDDSVKTDKKGVLDKEGNNMPKKLTLDSTTYEVEEKVADAYEAAVKDRDSLQGQLDMANAQIQSLKDEMSGMIKADQLDAKVKEYQSVKDTANKFGVSLEDGMSIVDMKKAIIKVANPALADTIDSKSDDYIDGAFGLCEGMAPNADACGGKKKEKDEDLNEDPKKKKKDSEDSDENKDSEDEPSTMMDAVNERLQKKFAR